MVSKIKKNLHVFFDVNIKFYTNLILFFLNCSVEIRKELNRRKTLTENIEDMGLSYNVNKSMGLPNNMNKRIEFTKKLANGFVEEDTSDKEEENIQKKHPKKHVVEEMERDSKDLRESLFRLPKGQVKYISYLMDRYGLNYKRMIKDDKNVYQETWRQLRAKCRKFMKIPEQFAKYLEERNLLEEEMDPNDPRWKEAETDMDD